MRLKKDSTNKKLRGAYYTPLQLANAMVKFFAPDDFFSVLEPSCGDGVFLDSLASAKLLDNLHTLTAVEIEKDEAGKVRQRYVDNKVVSVLTEDFFDFYKRNHQKTEYDLILGNPPYIRYQYLTQKQREIQSQILISHGMKANKLINSWVCFLVACVQMLSDNGKIALVVPAEILQVAYAEDLRLFLSNQLQRITLITFEKLVFPDIEQEVLVFIGEKGGDAKGIRIVEMDTLEDFRKLNLHLNGFKEFQHAKEKWTKYFISANEISVIQSIREDSRFARFADYGIINVGITTGNNDYFSVDEQTAKKYKLQSVTIPLIGRSSHAHGICFTEKDWHTNIDTGKKAMLINFPDTSFSQYSDSHKAYIKLGEDVGQHKGYKCAIRDRWYIVPSVWVPDAFFLRRNNLYPKFVLNQCGAVSTDTMHRMKFNEDIEPRNILLSYYNSISFAFTEICGRSYGGGVLEILPSEMGNIMLPIISNIDSTLRTNLLQQIDSIIRKNKNIEYVLDIIDKELLIKHLSIESALCDHCRDIWKKLQRRRLGRGVSVE
jgi:adenine-specific DNA-methyltransferase